MAEATYKIPTTAAERAAMDKAGAQYDKTRLEAALAILTGDKATAFLDEVNALIADGGLPRTAPTASNLTQFPKWLADMRGIAAQDVQNAENVINPPPPPVAAAPLN